MAMHDPHARVIGGESQQQVAAGGDGSRVSSGGILERQAGGAAVPGAGAGADNVEVVSVQVDGVREVDGRRGLDPPEVPA